MDKPGHDGGSEARSEPGLVLEPACRTAHYGAGAAISAEGLSGPVQARHGA
jgi:hypothetical protein